MDTGQVTGGRGSGAVPLPHMSVSVFEQDTEVTVVKLAPRMAPAAISV